MFKILSRSLDAIGIHGRKKSSAQRDPSKPRNDWKKQAIEQRSNVLNFCANWFPHRVVGSQCTLTLQGKECPLRKYSAPVIVEKVGEPVLIRG